MKRPFLTFLFVCALSAAAARGTSDGQPSDASLAGRVDSLEHRADRSRLAALMPRVSGFLQVGYQYTDTSSDFIVKRARLSLSGSPVPKFDYRVQFEFCKPRLVDAWLRYRPFRQLGFRAGQFKIPFSIENTEYGLFRFEFIDYPLVLRRLMSFDDVCGLAASGRDIGVSCSGSFFPRDGYDLLRYDLAVFNGEGINTRDRNKSKDLVARLMLRPVDGLLLSGSWYRGEFGPAHCFRERYGVGVCYDRGPVVVRGEWIGGTTGTSGGRFSSDGWYAMAGWRAPRNVSFTVRVDSFAADSSRRSETRQNNYTAGLLWSPVRFLRCQLNYTYEDYGRSAALSARNVATLLFTGIF